MKTADVLAKMIPIWTRPDVLQALEDGAEVTVNLATREVSINTVFVSDSFTVELGHVDDPAKLAAARDVLKSRRCGDSGCVYGSSGQCTNGGCRCGTGDKHEARRELRRLVIELREALGC